MNKSYIIIIFISNIIYHAYLFSQAINAKTKINNFRYLQQLKSLQKIFIKCIINDINVLTLPGRKK
ncbi:hypothetical protein KDK_39520 [Dictyobacter kobayashii]|uniref:Uncharacterized protein n=1 Tax=Dictyobacter kobayashii TaxID=2014872 RepID=A0A402ALZ7_9CHLR|nr:hypothetical protein KDK_39520 [Dictyobacter kobayashii]